MEILELNHVALHVKDVEKSNEFYGKILGFEPLPRPAFDFPGSWFRLGKAQELHLIGERTENVASHKRGNHFALRCKNLGEVKEKFEKANLHFIGPKSRPDGVQQIFIKDPDGYYLEFFEK